MENTSGPTPQTPVRLLDELDPTEMGLTKTPDHRTLVSMDEEALEQGYDSDGNIGPFFDQVEEEDNHPMEAEVELASQINGQNSEDTGAPSATPREEPKYCTFTDDEIKKLKVNEMRKYLKEKFGLKASNMKQKELREKMMDAVKNKHPFITTLGSNVVDNMVNDDFFATGAYWKELNPLEEVLEDEDGLNIDGEQFRAPTTGEGETINVPKRNYGENFDRPPFIQEALLPVRDEDGKVILNNGKATYEKTNCEETVPNIAFLHKNGIGFNSSPSEWFDVFFPRKSSVNSKISVEDITKWTNQKGMLDEKWLNFSSDEIMAHIGLYVLQGVSPSPQIEMKFSSQQEDPVNGNDLCHRIFGGKSKGNKRHRLFKTYFAACDPVVPTPDSKESPNWKVEKLIKQIMHISKQAMLIGKWVSVDKQAISFKGRHVSKIRINYKKEGDGFQCDVICSDGYTFTVFFRNQKSPQRFTQAGLSPLHSRVASMLCQLPSSAYKVGMDNLYVSAKFSHFCYSRLKKIMVHGVIRESGRGVPKCILQEKKTKKDEIEAVRGTVKAALLSNDSKCPGMVMLSFYDSKPVYILSNACEGIKWTEKKRKVYSKSLNKCTEITFLRPNVIDEYNNGMNNVDIADQLRLIYRMDRWMRKRKWWWSIFFWGFELLMVNAYITYCKYFHMHDLKPPLSHYEFHRAIALAWLSPSTYWKQQPVFVAVSQGTSASSPSATTVSTLTPDGNRQLGVARRGRKRRRSTSIPTHDSTTTCTATASTPTTSSTTASTSSSCAAKASKHTKISSWIEDKAFVEGASLNTTRLNMAFQHFPVPPANNNACCQLHSWVAKDKKRRYKKNLAFCPDCQVHLCMKCYSRFHKDHNMLAQKESLMNEYNADNKKAVKDKDIK